MLVSSSFFLEVEHFTRLISNKNNCSTTVDGGQPLTAGISS